jgi:hypothetical protein
LPGKVAVTAFLSGWCPAMSMVAERARRAAAEFGDRVEFRLTDTGEPGAAIERRMSDALYIDGRPVRTGPPPSIKSIRKKISRRVRRLG